MNAPMQEGMIVRVVRQPRNNPWIMDEVGYIERMRDEPGLCDFQAMTPDGQPAGCGTVPLDCLAPEPSFAWARAYEKLKAWYALQEARAQIRAAHRTVVMQGLALEHGITPEAVMAIYDAMRAAFDQRG